MAVAAAAIAIALLSYFYFPGHTWLQQDSQIYVAILEHQRDPAVLRNDLVADEPHTAYTIYDETALALRRATGLDFHTVLAAEQIVTRALGIWGLYLIVTAAGLPAGPAWLVVLIVSLGASIKGPEVLTFEYEPTPRAFAVPLVICAVGLAARGHAIAAALAGAAAFLFHPPAALPFWAVFLGGRWGRRFACVLPLLGAIAILIATSQGAHQPVLNRITPMDEQLLRMRAGYLWISAWPRHLIRHYLLIAAILAAAWWRVRSQTMLLAMAAIGLVSMPVSWLLVDQWKWRAVAELQPMRWLLFTTLAMQLLAGIAGARSARAGRFAEGLAWFLPAFLLPLQPVLTEGYTVRHWAVACGLAAIAALTMTTRLAPAVGLAVFLAVPVLGGVVNYPHLHTPELARFAEWARTSTPRDAVFQFAGPERSLAPGIFRAQALRAVYVDWKGGGQMVYLPDFGMRWWFRWQQTRTPDPAKFGALGIRYLVLHSGSGYRAYDTTPR